MVLGVRYLPLADATAILFAAPFLIVALSMPLLGERVRPASWIGVAVGFVAVLIVARPGFGELSKYTVFPALAAVFYAFLQLITRRLGALGEKPTTTLAWTLLVGGVASTPVAILNWAPVSATAWFYMVALGTVFGVSQLILIRAFTYAPAGVLAPIQLFPDRLGGHLRTDRVSGRAGHLDARRQRHDHRRRRLRREKPQPVELPRFKPPAEAGALRR